MTNHRFNFDKFRVFYKIDCQEYGESFQDYLVGVAGKQRQDNPDFIGWIHLASKPITRVNKALFINKKPPSNISFQAYKPKQ